MTLDWLTDSLRVHQLKLKYAQRKLKFYRGESKRPKAERAELIKKWVKIEAKERGMVAQRQREIVSKKRANRKAAEQTEGVAHYDGVPVAAWMVPYLDWARHTGHEGVRWQGRLTSGWRDPIYSRSLCMKMCGAPSCPGKCAGLSSNHVGSSKPNGALDVTDYQTFGRLMQHCPHEPKLTNHLPVDPVHFSVPGN